MKKGIGMIFGVSPTKDAVVIAQTTGSGIKAEAITELAAARSGLPVVRVTAASLKKVLGCATVQKWRARAEERFNPTGRQKN